MWFTQATNFLGISNHSLFSIPAAPGCHHLFPAYICFPTPTQSFIRKILQPEKRLKNMNLIISFSCYQEYQPLSLPD